MRLGWIYHSDHWLPRQCVNACLSRSQPGLNGLNMVDDKCKTNHNYENKIINYKRKCKSKKQNNKFRKHNNYSENIITSQKTQWQIRKQKQQVRKHNGKSDKPEEVGIVWDSAIGLGIDYSLLTGRDICQSRYRKNQKKPEEPEEFNFSI